MISLTLIPSRDWWIMTLASCVSHRQNRSVKLTATFIPQQVKFIPNFVTSESLNLTPLNGVHGKPTHALIGCFKQLPGTREHRYYGKSLTYEHKHVRYWVSYFSDSAVQLVGLWDRTQFRILAIVKTDEVQVATAPRHGKEYGKSYSSQHNHVKISLYFKQACHSFLGDMLPTGYTSTLIVLNVFYLSTSTGKFEKKRMYHGHHCFSYGY